MENTNDIYVNAGDAETVGTEKKRHDMPDAEALREAAERRVEYAAAAVERKKRESSAYAVRKWEAFKSRLERKEKTEAAPQPVSAERGRQSRLVLHLFTGVNLAVCVVLAVVGYRMGIFTSVESLQAWIGGFGVIAPIVFILFQAVQVVIPIIPGGVSLAGGVVIFGPWWGFVYNYIGICLGSLMVFAISRNYGKPLLYRLFPAKALEKYEKFANDRNRFAKMFAVAIFAPCAPDDMLCYLAGTTDMSWKTYTLIILLGKPASTAMYSIGLAALLQAIASLF